jgi:hypothetical protein
MDSFQYKIVDYTYIVLERKKTCLGISLVFIGPQVATFIYQRDRILLPNHQLGGWFCPRVVISLGKSYLQILIAVRSIRFIWYPLGGLRLENNNKKVSSWISHLNFKEIPPEGRMGAKLYIPSSINIWKKVLTKPIWADKKWADFWQISLYIK